MERSIVQIGLETAEIRVDNETQRVDSERETSIYSRVREAKHKLLTVPAEARTGAHDKLHYEHVPLDDLLAREGAIIAHLNADTVQSAAPTTRASSALRGSHAFSLMDDLKSPKSRRSLGERRRDGGEVSLTGDPARRASVGELRRASSCIVQQLMRLGATKLELARFLTARQELHVGRACDDADSSATRDDARDATIGEVTTGPSARYDGLWPHTPSCASTPDTYSRERLFAA